MSQIFGMLEQMFGNESDQPLSPAEELVEQAYDAPTVEAARKLAEQALHLDPECVDAYLVMGDKADTPGEAVGMMQSTLASSRAMLAECAARSPGTASDNWLDYETFLRSEARAIRTSTFYWRRMAEKDTSGSRILDYAGEVVHRNLDTISRMPVPREIADSLLRQYCRTHFADLASGVWRQRTPNKFRYLDETPDP